MSDKTYGLFPKPNKQKFISELEKKGARVVLFPGFSVQTIEDGQSLIGTLQRFDWIIFDDIFAAGFVLEKLKEQSADLYEFDNFRILAAGEAVADRLRFEQIHSDIIPTDLSPESLFEAISDYQTNLSGVKFIILRESDSQSKLGEILSDAGAEVFEMAVYRLDFEDESELPRIKALIKGGAIDKIIFAAPEEITVLEKIFAPEALRVVLRETEVSAVDEVTRKSLWENGFQTKEKAT